MHLEPKETTKQNTSLASTKIFICDQNEIQASENIYYRITKLKSVYVERNVKKKEKELRDKELRAAVSNKLV